MKELIDKIVSRKAKVAIIGLGYVGLPLAVEYASKGFCVSGIDIDARKVNAINKGQSYILDVPTAVLKSLVTSNRLKAFDNYKMLSLQDAIIICVPTPLRKTKEPDLSYIVNAVEEIAKFIRKNQLVVLESTTYPGTTEEIILPILSASGLTAGKDFFLAFSPERVDPSNKEFTTGNIPKVVGGITKECTQMARLLYGQIIKKVIPVSSSRVAEMVKLLENTFRSVNIGMVNELALMCNRLNIDVWEVIEAAKTKPFGFMPFYPGPGLGGHCIPIDPIYLSWKARLHDFEARFIELASTVNSNMPYYVVERIVQILNDMKKSLNGSKILVLGVAYKRDVNDLRESPALEIIEILVKKGAIINYHDPYTPSFAYKHIHMKNASLTKNNLKNCDCVVILTDHSNVDYEYVIQNARVIFDTRNALRKFPNRKNIIKL